MVPVLVALARARLGASAVEDVRAALAATLRDGDGARAGAR
jgi:hypothetical protein